jgi:magnesium transporter
MIRVFYIENDALIWEKFSEGVSLDSSRKYLWIDLLRPTQEDRKKVEIFFGVTLQTYQEAVEIESSSRYNEDGIAIKANSGFLSTQSGVFKDNDHPEIKQVSFLLKGKLLFTVRDIELDVFADAVRKIKTARQEFIRSGAHIWLLLLETRIDSDADYIESLTRLTTTIRSAIRKNSDFQDATLRKIAELQENTILIRESIIDKQRLISALMRSPFIDEDVQGRLKVIMKDVISLLQHTQFSFERLEYLQNTLLGLVNIEQNKIIKIFTVVSVVFMPPTLIASIYGMNFNGMPELTWSFGYPAAIVMMICSSVLTLLYFKRKNWL